MNGDFVQCNNIEKTIFCEFKIQYSSNIVVYLLIFKLLKENYERI